MRRCWSVTAGSLLEHEVGSVERLVAAVAMTTGELELCPRLNTSGLLEEVAFEADTSSSGLAVAVMPPAIQAELASGSTFSVSDANNDCVDDSPGWLVGAPPAHSSEENEAS